MLARMIGADGKSAGEFEVSLRTRVFDLPLAGAGQANRWARRRFVCEGMVGPEDGGPFAIFREQSA